MDDYIDYTDNENSGNHHNSTHDHYESYHEGYYEGYYGRYDPSTIIDVSFSQPFGNSDSRGNDNGFAAVAFQGSSL